MASRKPVSAPPSGGGLKVLLSPRSPLEAAQFPVICKGAPGRGTEVVGVHERSRGDVAGFQMPEDGKSKAVGNESVRGPYVAFNASNKEHGSHRGSAGKESSPQQKEKQEAEGDKEKMLNAAQLKELGNAHFTKKDFQLAAEYYTQALEFDSENVVLYANRAQSRLNQGRSVSALDDANHAVMLNPSWWKAHAKRAQACLALGQFRSAVGSFEEALKLQPNDVGLKKGLSEAKSGVSCLKEKSMQHCLIFRIVICSSGPNADSGLKKDRRGRKGAKGGVVSFLTTFTMVMIFWEVLLHSSESWGSWSRRCRDQLSPCI
jgi:hypothetical protein